MAGDDRVRHCAECNLNVYNFAAMTGFEIAELLANRQGRRVCARIYRRADGTMITQDCPKGLRAVIRRVSRVAGAAFAAAMSLNFAVAQTPASAASAPQQQKEGESAPTGEVGFTVVDSQGAVIPGVEVVLMEKKEAGGKKDKKTETVIQLKATTDSAGSVRFAGLRLGLYEVKAISKYFKTYKKEMTVKDHSAEQLKLAIDPKVETVTVGVLIDEESAFIDTSSSQVIHMMPVDRQSGSSSPVQFPQRGPAVPMRQ